MNNEINLIMNQHGYNLPSHAYIDMINKYQNESKFIDHITYDCFENKFTMWSKNGNEWKFSVYHKDKE